MRVRSLLVVADVGSEVVMAGRFDGVYDDQWKLFYEAFPDQEKLRLGPGMPRAPLRHSLNSILYIQLSRAESIAVVKEVLKGSGRARASFTNIAGALSATSKGFLLASVLFLSIT